MASNNARHLIGQHGEHEPVDAREESDTTLELREEELSARKTTTERGRVAVGTEVVEEQQTIEVPVTREEVTGERHAVDRRPSADPISANGEVLRVPVHEDQVSVGKEAVVYEEVNVGKRAVQETQRVSDTVRKEVVDIDATGEVDEVDVNERR